MYSLLIIGGTGFFGKSFLDAYKRGVLIKYNITRIIILGRNVEKFKVEFPELIINNVEFVSGDISTINNLPYSDYIIHAASSTKMEDYVFDNNIYGKKNLENAISNFCKIAPNFLSKSKILYCSSGSVYGKQPLDLYSIREDFPFNNDFEGVSREKKEYCLIKRLSEEAIIELGKCGMNVGIARCFAFKGKYLPKNQHYAYGNFISQAEKHDKITVNAKGIVYRSYMDSDDLVISLIKVLQIVSTNCPIYNVGSDRPISIHKLAENIAFKYGVEFEHEIDEVTSPVIDRYIPNIERLKNLDLN